MSKDFKERKKCALCNSSSVEKIINFGKTPLANSYLSKENSVSKVYPLTLGLCKVCGHLQLNEIINPKIMFSNYSYVSGTSKVLVDHFNEYASKLITKFKLKKKEKILDIACNDGTFLKQFIKKGFSNIIGVEPAKNLRKHNKKINIDINTFFFDFNTSNKLKKKYKSFKIISANNVCAHIPSINSFVKGIENIMSKESIFVFEVSYLMDVYKKMTFDTIYHEHVSYHSLKPLIFFFKKYNLEVFDFDLIKAQGGSIRVYVSKKDHQLVKTKKIYNQIKKEEQINLFKKETFKKYYSKIKKEKIKLNKLIKSLKENKERIVGFGAPAKLTTFSYVFDISKKKVDFIIDDNPLKQNTFSPGKKIPIKDYEFLKRNKWDTIIIFAWNFSDSIILKLKKDFKNKKIIIPFPQPKIIRI
ncbi:class I SAM-dependent methyltransferase [Candidatus Pelagibacter ubique]|nr:class I SAM-dependent methyltransferase [Candidatus Pelagibacter ubique]